MSGRTPGAYEGSPAVETRFCGYTCPACGSYFSFIEGSLTATSIVVKCPYCGNVDRIREWEDGGPGMAPAGGGR